MQGKGEFLDDLLKGCRERVNKPMELKELRQRLKHIAGLCWGLSIDIQNELERNVQLKTENDGLRKEVQRLSLKVYQREYKRNNKKAILEKLK